MAAIQDRPHRADDPSVPRADRSTQTQTEFPLRHRELQTLLEEVDKALHKCGLALRRHGAPDSREAAAALEPVPTPTEPQASGQRGRVREMATLMFSRLGTRLDILSSTFGRLSEEERTGLAALLRLPEEARSVIASLLRLPEQDRTELSIGFRLSETECRALADLLEPYPAREAAPTIAIVDSDIEDEQPATRPAERPDSEHEPA